MVNEYYKNAKMNQPIEGKVLGKLIAYPQTYTPDILVAVPRSLNRRMYNLEASALPFWGFDVWHAYELGFLTKKGLPVTGVLKIVYAANSEFLVESKSLKLYLNSFNMERFGNNVEDGINQILTIIDKDLNQVIKAPVTLSFFKENSALPEFDFPDYEVLENLKEMAFVNFQSFSENPALLVSTQSNLQEIKVATHLLRSNCKITHQPDWGSAFIYLKGKQTPDLSALLQYLVSIRNENHFHEEICEMVYKRLWDIFQPERLMVTCIYTRRGGIDICPARASHEELLPKNLINSGKLSFKLLRQ